MTRGHYWRWISDNCDWCNRCGAVHVHFDTGEGWWPVDEKRHELDTEPACVERPRTPGESFRRRGHCDSCAHAGPGTGPGEAADGCVILDQKDMESVHEARVRAWWIHCTRISRAHGTVTIVTDRGHAQCPGWEEGRR